MTTREQKEIVRRLRNARWVDIKIGLPPPPPAELAEQELARLREHLQLIGASDRTIRAWEFVSEETKAEKLKENAQARVALEMRIRQLSSSRQATRSARGIHGLA